MTTIVVDPYHRKIVADKRVTQRIKQFKPMSLIANASLYEEKSIHSDDFSKILPVNSETVIAGCGCVATIHQFYNNYIQGKPTKIKDHSFVYVIKLYGDGFYIENFWKKGHDVSDFTRPKFHNFCSIGSGSSYAAAIMYHERHNKNRAVKAIQTAAEFDDYTSEVVDVFEFKLYDDVH